MKKNCFGFFISAISVLFSCPVLAGNNCAIVENNIRAVVQFKHICDTGHNHEMKNMGGRKVYAYSAGERIQVGESIIGNNGKAVFIFKRHDKMANMVYINKIYFKVDTPKDYSGDWWAITEFDEWALYGITGGKVDRNSSVIAWNYLGFGYIEKSSSLIPIPNGYPYPLKDKHLGYILASDVVAPAVNAGSSNKKKSSFQETLEIEEKRDINEASQITTKREEGRNVYRHIEPIPLDPCEKDCKKKHIFLKEELENYRAISRSLDEH